jgi:hypothetical protein
MVIQHFDAEKSPMPEELNKSYISNSNYTSQNIKIDRSKTSKDIPLFSIKNRCKSVTKNRRSRKQRYNQQSSERICGESFYKKSSVTKIENPGLRSSFSAKFESKIPTLQKSKTRASFCKNEKSKVLLDHSILGSKSFQVEKAANVISKKTFEFLKHIRPVQTSIQVIRSFIKVLKLYNIRMCLFNEKDNWAKMLNTLTAHSSVILKEVKIL